MKFCTQPNFCQIPLSNFSISLDVQFDGLFNDFFQSSANNNLLMNIDDMDCQIVDLENFQEINCKNFVFGNYRLLKKHFSVVPIIDNHIPHVSSPQQPLECESKNDNFKNLSTEWNSGGWNNETTPSDQYEINETCDVYQRPVIEYIPLQIKKLDGINIPSTSKSSAPVAKVEKITVPERIKTNLSSSTSPSDRIKTYMMDNVDNLIIEAVSNDGIDGFDLNEISPIVDRAFKGKEKELIEKIKQRRSNEEDSEKLVCEKCKKVFVYAKSFETHVENCKTRSIQKKKVKKLSKKLKVAKKSQGVSNVLVCEKCKKSYIRKEFYEKHVESCKKLISSTNPKKNSANLPNMGTIGTRSVIKRLKEDGGKK